MIHYRCLGPLLILKHPTVFFYMLAGSIEVSNAEYIFKDILSIYSL